MFGSGENQSVSSGENRVVCVEDWVFGSGENRSASGCSVRARTEVPLGVRFGREPKCVRGKTVIPRMSVYIVILWDDSCILGLSAFLWRLCDCDSILRMYLMFGLSATSHEMLSTAQGAE